MLWIFTSRTLLLSVLVVGSGWLGMGTVPLGQPPKSSDTPSVGSNAEQGESEEDDPFRSEPIKESKGSPTNASNPQVQPPKNAKSGSKNGDGDSGGMGMGSGGGSKSASGKGMSRGGGGAIGGGEGGAGMGGGGMGGMGGMGGGMSGMGGGMGGMGGGGMGGGMRGGMGSAGSSSSNVEWGTPNAPMPRWLRDGERSLLEAESVREKLNTELELDHVSDRFSEAIDYLSEETNLSFFIPPYTYEQSEIAQSDRELPFRGRIPVREHLRRILEPFDLEYVVRENWVEIHLKGECTSLRYYEVAFVLPNSALVPQLISTIETTIATPDAWTSNGGEFAIKMIGSLLVVNASEEAHQQIESLLFKLSQAELGNREPK